MADTAHALDVADTDPMAAHRGQRPDPARWGQRPVDHPLLGAAVELAGSDRVLLTGRLSPAAQPWLTDHSVHGSPLFPGSGFVELALRAGEDVGCGTLEELVVEAPLLLDEHGATRIQVSLGEPDAAGRRSVEVYAAADDGSGNEPLWRRHAGGVLSEAEPEPQPRPEAGTRTDAVAHADADAEVDAGTGAFGTAAWPPEGAEPVPLDGLYSRLGTGGYGYGPAFQGLRAVWRRGDETFAEVALPEDAPRDGRFRLHPVLLNSALHPEGWDERARLSFSWHDVRLHGDGGPDGATTLRVRLAPSGDGGVGLLAADRTGAPVATVGSLRTRPVRADVLLAAGDPVADVSYQVDWLPLASPGSSGVLEHVVAHESGRDCWAVLEEEPSGVSGAARSIGLCVDTYPDVAALADAVRAGAPAPGTVVVPCLPAKEPVSEAVRATAGRALAVVQDWLAADALSGTRLALVTQGAVSTRPDDDSSGDPAAAAAWGLVRSVNGEHPGRTVLLDVDSDLTSGFCPTEDAHALGVQLVAALASGEQQLALRRGVLRVPRLTPGAHASAPRACAGRELPVHLDPEGLALVTGGTGMMGAVFARHLVRAYGVRHLLLVSLDGRQAEVSAVLEDELTALGASVTFAACDLADRDALARLLGGLDRRLTAVVHTAGVLDDGPVTEQSPERLDTVLRPKVDAAVHLDELTRDLDPEIFLVCASVAGVFGGPGQANYGAANAALDAFAVQRRACGRPATSVAWGVWSPRRGMATQLTGGHWAKVTRAGVLPVSDRQGTAVFDAALAAPRADVVGVRLDLPAMRRRYRPVPPFFREVVRPPAGTGADGFGAHGSWGAELRTAPAEERERLLLDLVRRWAAGALGAEGPEEIAPDGDLLAAGLDSLGAVELRAALAEATGLRLPPTLVLDEPVPAGLAARLAERMPAPPPLPAPPPSPGPPAGGRLRAAFRRLRARRRPSGT
ncbi:type I polyketide synthase [Streptomyces armeniacus]|nr:type I polyketide synthase [Streptomyces armeniacus]